MAETDVLYEFGWESGFSSLVYSLLVFNCLQIHSENCLGTPCSTSEYHLHKTIMLLLVPMCTVYRVVKSTSLEACYRRVRLPAPHYTHHNYWHPLGGHQLIRHQWPELWTAFHLSCNLIHQVWLWERRRAAICSWTGGLASWIKTASWSWQAVTLHSSNGARIIGVLHIWPLCLA